MPGIVRETLSDESGGNKEVPVTAMSVRFLLTAGLTLSLLCGCRRDPRMQVYIENVNAEKRMLEDTLYDLQYDYETKLKEVERLQAEVARLKGTSTGGSATGGAAKVKAPSAPGGDLFPDIPELKPPTVEAGTPDTEKTTPGNVKTTPDQGTTSPSRARANWKTWMISSLRNWSCRKKKALSPPLRRSLLPRRLPNRRSRPRAHPRQNWHRGGRRGRCVDPTRRNDVSMSRISLARAPRPRNLPPPGRPPTTPRAVLCPPTPARTPCPSKLVAPPGVRIVSRAAP